VRKAIVILAGVLTLGALPDSASACSGIAIPRETEFQFRAAVFIGEITAVTHNANRIGNIVGPGTIEVTFKVTRVVKGEMKVNDSIVVRTSDQESACGIASWARESPSSRWIVYADRSGGALQAGILSRTKRADSAGAAEDLKFFDALSPAR
jgi:hypothetical protein